MSNPLINDPNLAMRRLIHDYPEVWQDTTIINTSDLQLALRHFGDHLFNYMRHHPGLMHDFIHHAPDCPDRTTVVAHYESHWRKSL